MSSLDLRLSRLVLPESSRLMTRSHLDGGSRAAGSGALAACAYLATKRLEGGVDVHVLLQPRQRREGLGAYGALITRPPRANRRPGSL